MKASELKATIRQAIAEAKAYDKRHPEGNFKGLTAIKELLSDLQEEACAAMFEIDEENEEIDFQ